MYQVRSYLGKVWYKIDAEIKIRNIYIFDNQKEKHVPP